MSEYIYDQLFKIRNAKQIINSLLTTAFMNKQVAHFLKFGALAAS